MVLQRAPYASYIYGWATVGDAVTVTVDAKAYAADVDSTGFWKAKLDPTEAGGPHSIVVSSAKSSTKILLSNVLFGDVWVCSGQSNMQFTVSQAFNASTELDDANNYPNIRVFSVGESHYSSTPLNELAGIAQTWSIASSKSIGVGNWSEFSAACWFTGRNLYDKYKVPLGLISTNWGGTVIQAWSSPDALKECNVTASGNDQEANSVLYNAMVVPFLQQTVLGALWYQGEQNVGEAPLYTCMFQAMIKDWRARFPYGILSFVFVQLAPWITSADVQDLRQAQKVAADVLPGVGFASAVDLGDALSPFGNIHPRDKQTVGARLALAAESIAYGDKTVSWRGPEFRSVSLATSGANVTATVVFDLFLSRGLVAKSATCPTSADCGNWVFTLSNGKEVEGIQLDAKGNTVQVLGIDLPAGVKVTWVSYAYAPWPLTTLFNIEGLPAIPFKAAIPTTQ